MADVRRVFVLNTIAGSFAPADQKEAYVQYLDQDESGAISAFLDDPSVGVLQASVSGLGTGQIQLQLSNSPGFPDNCQYQVVLTKLRPGTLSPADIPANLSVSTMSNSPLSSLYHCLRDVYSPMLGVASEGGGGVLSGRLADLVVQVQAGLGAAARKAGASVQVPATSQDPTQAPLQDILTPLDEISYWAEVASGQGPAGKAAAQVHMFLEPLRAPFEELLKGEAEGEWEGVKEVIDQTINALRQVWPIKLTSTRWAFSQKRFENLVAVTGAALAAYVQAHLRSVDLWNTPFGELKSALMGASQVMARWVAEVKALCQDWAMGIDNGGHEWEGQPYADAFALQFQERVEEIYHMRENHDELAKLLGADEASNLGISTAFAPFAHSKALQVSEYSGSSWRAAKEEYERRMHPVEQRVSQKLRELFGAVIIPSLMSAIGQRQGAGGAGLIQPQQVFHELKRYSGLLARPVIAQTLHSESDTLAKQVDKHLEQVQQEYDDHRSSSGDGQGRGPHGVVESIMWAMGAALKLRQTREVLGLMLGPAGRGEGGSAALRSCLAVAGDLLKEVEDFKKQLFDEWQARTSEQLSDMAQWKNSRLMTFDSQNAHVKTHFNDSLVHLLREVRQLQSLGFNVKREVLTEVETANRFYRYGMVLKQRANFYNNISTEMIPCQKPMLLAFAIEFEKVLMNPKDVQGKEITWRNAAALDGYVRRLNDVADKLAEKNRQLRKWHDVLRDKVVGLMSTDLVRHKDRWAQGVKEMREIFVRLESESYTKESQQVWRQHWDFQLFKALEYQYSQGIECINKTLPEVEIKMVFRQHKLQYEPPLEELRIRHYKDFLNTFLGLPLRMKGVSDLSERPGFFRPVVDANPAGIAKVYAAAEALFAQLADELRKFQDWVVMGSVDLDEFVDENLQEVSDWELNFRVLKAAAKDVEKLPNELRVDCYKVSLLPVKAAIDEHMKKLQEALVSSLRRKAVAEKEAVEEFMKGGRELFGRQANSVEDIGRAGSDARNMVDGLALMAQARRRIDEKNKLLRQMAAGSGKDAQFAVVDLMDVNNQWEAFTTQLQQYDTHLEEQKAQLAQIIVKKLEDAKLKIQGFASRWEELKPRGGPSGNPGVVLARIEEYNTAIQEMREEMAQLHKEAEAFKLDVGDFEMLDAVALDVAGVKKVWDRYADFLKERNEIANRDWLSVRDQVWRIEDFLAKWSKASEGASADDAVAVILMGEIDTYRKCLPYLRTSMRGAGWEDVHWNQLFTMLGLKTTGPAAVTKENVTLAHFLDAADALVRNADAIKHLDSQAQGESMIRKALSELKAWGLMREFALSESTSQNAQRSRRTALIKEWRDVMSEVGDHQSLVASLRQSAFHHLFKDEVGSWDAKLGFLNEGLALLNQIQRKWVYLEPIFARGALPQQQQRFRNVDEEFRRVMAQLEAQKKVVAFAEIPGIRDKLPQMAQQLDVCQRALSDFLEEKRSQFPRFYFIGDDDLLEILGQSKNPTVIQSHLKKLFAGIHKVKFTPDSGSILAMQSMDTEVVDLAGGVRVTEQVETWLGELSKAMVGTLRGQLEGVQTGRLQDEFKQAASQTLCLKEAINFTAAVEAGLRGQGGMAKVQADVKAQLSRLAQSDFTGFALLQLKKQALVLDFIHYLDVCDQLQTERVTNPAEWAWRRQLRYYGKQGGVQVAMAEALFEYTWEYQGNAPKLVYTPLTDKCYLTLTQGMALGYGGNPYGPAGTGKTESVKALGQAFARQVLVFNCDEEFDFKSMGRIFVGLVKCGAWGCFDEFNRLDEEVLSAVSQQIQIIQGALKEGAKTMQFMEKSVEVDKNAGIFVTLNPAGKGYGGRSKLPDNLKQLFRSIAMTVPDNELIAEVLLISEGFAHGKDLARKLVSLFQLSRELLSPQQHYDWGLRALKTCLGIAGRELREVRKTVQTLDAQQEAEIIVRAVCATKLPTLTYEDNSRFRALLSDLFPGVAVTDTRNASLEEAMKAAAAAMNIELTQQQVEKILQLHLACEQRIGVIIVGPSGSGKSTLWEVLEGAYEKLGRKPVVYKMNPKAMPRQQLLGSMNMDTREWSDGVLTAAARKVVKEPLERRSWIICDGDVDPEWIESLNSVLDDNRLLTMPNGERIQFANNVNFIFECHSLEFASPATVSRCGMLFLSDESLDLRQMLKKWLKTHTASDPAQLEGWFNDYLGKALSWCTSHPRAVETTRLGILNSALSHCALGPGSKLDFAAALARGMSCNMADQTRADFLTDLCRLTGEVGLLDVGGGMDPLLCLGEELRDTPLGAEELSNLVVTVDVQQALTTIAPWLKNHEPFILVGPEGCGKTTLLEYCFKRIVGVQVAEVNCSAQTCAANVIQKLVQVCGKPVTTSTGKALRPPDNSRIILFLKDLNLPRPDKYNTAQLIAFLQQLLTHQGYYDEHLEFIRVERIQIIGVMSPPSTVGRHPLSTRFTAQVRIACLNYPDKEALTAIYTQMIGKSLTGGSVSPGNLARAMMEVYAQVRETFTVNDQAHYQFNPRDLTEWVRGVQRYATDGSVTLLEAVAYEAKRIFMDRLVGGDAERFASMLTASLNSLLSFRGNTDFYASTLGASAEDRLSGDQARLRLAKWGPDDFGGLVAEKLKGFCREFKELSLVLFPEVLDRLARFDRVMSLPGGSLLLCGPSGTGRRSCMLLLAYMHLAEFYTPKMTRNYGIKNFRNDLKEVMKKAGVENKAVLLFVEDHQMVAPAMIEDVNALLSGGEVPGLFTMEELAKELGPLEAQRNDDNTYTGPPTNYSYFIHRVRRNLHIAVSMDPSNEGFRARCESNPALLTRCAVQWLEAWDKTGMDMVATTALQEALGGGKDAARTAGPEQVEHMIRLHNMMLGLGATPRQYVAFVNLYIRILSSKRDQVTQQRQFLKGGLSKLAEAEATVDTLSQEADKQRTLLKAAQSEADEALKRIEMSIAQAAERRTAVAELKKKLSVEEVEMRQRRVGVEAELKDVQPMIDEARKAVGQIKKEHIDEIRSLKMPPDAIRDVLEGVLMVLGQQDTSWNNMKKFLGSKAVKDEIINYDARKITADMRTKVGKLLATKGNSFEHAVIYRVSVAAAPLASWVKANMAYSKVLEKVAPLENELSGLRNSIEESSRLIVQYEAELKTCDETVAQLKADFGKKTGEAERLRANLERAESTVTAARSLLEKLGGEKHRWMAQVKSLEGDLTTLPLFSLVTAAFVTYLPPHPEDVRAKALTDWLAYLSIKDFDLCRYMSSESEMLKWKSEGLPADVLSMQNGVVILNSKMAPLVMDPSTQACSWLLHHIKATCPQVEVTTMHDQRFVNTLELAVRFGKVLVVQEVDKIEPILYPLLRLDLDRQGPRFVVNIGDKAVDYNDTFRLYMVTRNPNPLLPPDARSLVAATNFTTTRSGLETQLLGLTIQREQPELEKQKSALLKQEEELKMNLADLEKSLLQALATSTGSLLENKELLDSLNETKSKSTIIATSLTESAQLQQSLDTQRAVYSPIAQRGSSMYFLIQDLVAVNHMYAFSLKVFLDLFRKALAQDTPPGDVQARIAMLSDVLMELVFAYISRSVFNADRLTFGMHMARHMQHGTIKPDEWNFFLGKPSVDATGSTAKPSWVREENAAAFSLLAANFPGLVQAAELSDAGVWGPWAAGSEGGDTAAMPHRVVSKVTPFQHLLLVKTFRPDRLQNAMTAYVCSMLNVRGVAPPSFSLKTLVEGETNADQPVLLLTTPGADPSQELGEYASASIGKARYHEVAMGQGQAEGALSLLRDCSRSGDWLCLKNVHLVVSWLPTLEKELYTLQKHPDFRIFLTSEPHNKFPTTLLEGSLKVTFEAPPGLKKNLLRTYEGWSQDFLSSGPPLRAQLLFVLAWFHAVVQERRTYIPQGWSKFYEFSFADLRSGADIVGLATRDARAGPQWQLLHGLLENAIYGGRVDNLSDAKVLRTYLHQYFHPEVVGLDGGRVRPLPGCRVAVPTSTHRNDYMQIVSQLSETDSPAMFGLPANADRAAQQASSGKVVLSLRAMSLGRDASAGFDRQRWMTNLGPLLRLWEQLASQASVLKTAARDVAGYRPRPDASPVDSFVALERAHGVQLVATLDRSLAQLSRVLRGQETLSSNVQKLGAALVADQVPGTWDSLWEGPDAPADYVRAVVARAVAVEGWWQKCSQGNLLSGPLDLSGLFHPGTFLNALRQQAARALRHPMDLLKLATTWDPRALASAPPGTAAQIGGLLMQGCAFDGARLSTLSPDAPTSRVVPPMFVAWVPREQGLPYGSAYLSAPIYTNEDRTRVLTEVQLPVNGQEEAHQWILAGVAMFLAN